MLFFFPDIPLIMRFRGFLYSLGMPSCGSNFQVAHNVTLNSIEGLTVGNNVYLAMGNIIYAHGKAIIGNNVMFANYWKSYFWGWLISLRCICRERSQN